MPDDVKRPPLVLLLGRDPAEVGVEETRALVQRFKGDAIALELHRIDPTSTAEHIELCEQLKPAAVVLRSAKDRNYAGVAQELGIPHVAYLKNVEKMRLMELLPNGYFMYVNEQGADVLA